MDRPHIPRLPTRHKRADAVSTYRDQPHWNLLGSFSPCGSRSAQWPFAFSTQVEDRPIAMFGDGTSQRLHMGDIDGNGAGTRDGKRL